MLFVSKCCFSLKMNCVNDVVGRCAFGVDTDVQNNPENIYFKKVAEFFDGTSVLDSFLYRAGEIVPQIHVILGKLFRLDTYTRTLINTRILPLISSTAQLNELPITWLLNRLHVIVERRQETPISRIDLLHYMLQDTTKESIDVSNILSTFLEKKIKSPRIR